MQWAWHLRVPRQLPGFPEYVLALWVMPPCDFALWWLHPAEMLTQPLGPPPSTCGNALYWHNALGWDLPGVSPQSEEEECLQCRRPRRLCSLQGISPELRGAQTRRRAQKL